MHRYSRDVPQSAWFIDGVRKGSNSVEEIVSGAAARSALPCANLKFHASGREDIDVRMLPPEGRPFMLWAQRCDLTEAALNDPRTCQGIADAVNAHQGLNIRGDVSIGDVRRATADEWSALQKSAEERNKTYLALCWSERALTLADMAFLSNKRPFTLSQLTPLRVMHRRSNLNRPREVSNITATLVNKHWFELRVEVQGGTYVKEFVHGDLGRTTPSISSLLACRCDILQLDVESVQMMKGSDVDSLMASPGGGGADARTAGPAGSRRGRGEGFRDDRRR